MSAFLEAELAGNVTGACAYVVPSTQSECNDAAASVPHLTGHFAIGHVAISGRWAVVAITGRVCPAGSGCQSNADPSAGLPSGSESVRQAAARAGGSGGFSPVPCEQVAGKWYVYLSS